VARNSEYSRTLTRTTTSAFASCAQLFSDRRRRGALWATGLLVVFLGGLQAGVFPRPVAQISSDALQTVLALAAGLACLWTARLRHQRWFWLAFGAGVLAWAAGQAIWTVNAADLFTERRVEPWDHLFLVWRTKADPTQIAQVILNLAVTHATPWRAAAR